MAFEYNGFIHRDLEPQVRYDAEQIQLLKQADVTINENLQTINTEIDGKLNKPANPSAESAVTMLADGVVGTKPLSEIGGGKLYLHKLSLNVTLYDNSTGYLYIDIYKTDNILIDTLDKIATISNNFVGNYKESTKRGVVAVYATDTTIEIMGVVTSPSGAVPLTGRVTINNIIDTYTEL